LRKPERNRDQGAKPRQYRGKVIPYRENSLTTPYVLGIDFFYGYRRVDRKTGEFSFNQRSIQKLSSPPIALQPKFSLHAVLFAVR
jgi:hypothetical protein